MKWNVLGKINNPKEITKILLENRSLRTKKEVNEFLNPIGPGSLTPTNVGIDSKILDKAIKRIQKAIKESEPIVVYGDYDADGICSTAILWETLRDLGAKVMPFIPLREKEGYGLSKEGIDSILSDPKYNFSHEPNNTHKPHKSHGLIISVDSGIVASEAVDYAKRKRLDVIIIDHHEKPKKLPEAYAIVHTTKLCAAGISFIFSKELLNSKYEIQDSKLELAAIATVTDLMPLLGPNRSIVKHGLEALNKTTRPGLRALFNIAGIEKVGTYEIGFMIGPRLNASGRIENALLALRLLCTSDFNKALEYAKELNATNTQRQEMMQEMTLHAISSYDKYCAMNAPEKIIVIEHESYHQGIIGLIAGKLVEKYYLPAIVIAKDKEVSKASARSISGFNIIEAIRSNSELLLGAGGHPMAAGFSIATTRIKEFKEQITLLAQKQITTEMLDRALRVDCKLDVNGITLAHEQVKQFEPFGLGNPEPTFASEVLVQNIRTVGQEGKHLKLVVSSLFAVHSDQNREPSTVNDEIAFDCIAFGQGQKSAELKIGNQIQIAYTIDLNTWNGRQNLQLKIKDIVLKSSQ